MVNINDLSDPETKSEKLKRLYYEKFLPGAKKAVAAGQKAHIVTKKVLDKLPAHAPDTPMVSTRGLKRKDPNLAPSKVKMPRPPKPSQSKQVIEIRHVYVTEAKAPKKEKEPERSAGYKVNDFVLGRGKYRG